MEIAQNGSPDNLSKHDLVSTEIFFKSSGGTQKSFFGPQPADHMLRRPGLDGVNDLFASIAADFWHKP